MNYYGNGADYAYYGQKLTNQLLQKDPIEYGKTIPQCAPTDYAIPHGFKLSKSGFQAENGGTWHIESVTGPGIRQDPLKTSNSCGDGTTIGVNAFAELVGKLKELEKGDTTVSLYAGWEKCAAGWYCPADQEPQKCPGDMTSAPGAYKIEQCYTKEPCSKGRYLPANGSTCAPCPEGSYCPDQKTYYYSGTNQGKTACPNGYTSAEGSTNQHQCYITCDPGTFVTTKYGTCNGRCGKGEYINDPTKVHYGDTNACTKCTENVQNGQFTTNNSCDFKCNEPDYEKTSDRKACQLAKIHCDPGRYLDNKTCQICEAGYYCPGITEQPNGAIQGRYNCTNLITFGSNIIREIANGYYLPGQSQPTCQWECNVGYQKRKLNMSVKSGGSKLEAFCTPYRFFNTWIVLDSNPINIHFNNSISWKGKTQCNSSILYTGRDSIPPIGRLQYFYENNDCGLTSNDFNSISTYYKDSTPITGGQKENKWLYNYDAIQNRKAFTSTGGLITILTGGTLDLNGYYNLSIIEPNGNLENYGECSVFLDLPDSLHDNFTTENDSRERLYLVGVGVTDFSSPLPYGTKYIFNCHSDNYEVYSHEARGKLNTTTKRELPVYFGIDDPKYWDWDWDWSSFDFGPIGNGFGALI